MKQQILIIHGGSAYTNYKSYIKNLETKEVELDRLKYRLDWKDSITSDLGDKYEVLVPRMPNSTNARYKEWKMWFERIIPLLNDGVVLIGHSLGGIFLAKYLSQDIMPKNIKAIILVAAPFKKDDINEDLADFKLPKSLSKLDNQAKNIVLLQSEDDAIVPAENVQIYKNNLPNSKVIMFKNNGHFNQEHFPELVKLIRSF